MNNSICRAGIDIGGTKTNIGIISEDGRILSSRAIPSEGASDTPAFVDRICSVLEDLSAQQNMQVQDLTHIGVGIPGTADTEHGVVEYSCNLFGFGHVPLGDFFEKRIGRKITLVQDSWAAAWAEHLFGAGRNVKDMMCLTLGTGIGCGVVLGNKVYGGPMHTAGEIGHTPIVWQGRQCSCGRRGCLETYASGTAIWKQATERFPEKLIGKPQHTQTVFEMAYAEDTDALSLISECVEKLGYGIAVAIDLFAVNTVVISGGLSAHQKLMVEPLEGIIRQYGYPSWSNSREINVCVAELGPDAPMVGAAFLDLSLMAL